MKKTVNIKQQLTAQQTTHLHYLQLHNLRILQQASRESGVGGKLTQTLRRLGGPPSLRNTKYTRMHHFENKIHKFSTQRGPAKNVWGALWEYFPGPHYGSL